MAANSSKESPNAIDLGSVKTFDDLEARLAESAAREDAKPNAKQRWH
ncbi:MAG: hypothetical protein O3A00_13685 [Planctomycetota bacterium]|nr:hypothetical protein [Planctomycetota bacterium]